MAADFGDNFPSSPFVGQRFSKQGVLYEYHGSGAGWQQYQPTPTAGGVLVCTQYPANAKAGDLCFRSDLGVVAAFNGSAWAPIGAGGGGASGWEFFETYYLQSVKQNANGDLYGATFEPDVTTSGMTFTPGSTTAPDTLAVALPTIPAGFDAWIVEIDQQLDLYTASGGVPFAASMTCSLTKYETIVSPTLIQPNQHVSVYAALRALAPANTSVVSWTHSVTAGGLTSNPNQYIAGSVRIAAYKYQRGQAI